MKQEAPSPRSCFSAGKLCHTGLLHHVTSDQVGFEVGNHAEITAWAVRPATWRLPKRLPHASTVMLATMVSVMAATVPLAPNRQSSTRGRQSTTGLEDKASRTCHTCQKVLCPFTSATQTTSVHMHCNPPCGSFPSPIHLGAPYPFLATYGLTCLQPNSLAFLFHWVVSNFHLSHFIHLSNCRAEVTVDLGFVCFCLVALSSPPPPKYPGSENNS